MSAAVARLGAALLVCAAVVAASNPAVATATTTSAAKTAPASGEVAAPCRAGTVYLTFDTGNMHYAQWIADLLQRQQIRATFFLANEKTPEGDFALDARWQPFWKSLASSGHAFGSHTFDHVYFKTATRGTDGRLQASVRPQFGARANQTLTWDAPAVCGELDRVNSRFQEMTGRPLDPLWRAPGGKAPGEVMQAAQSCGYRHVHWAQAGFLGDELPSDRFPNKVLLERALAGLKNGDIVMAHLGIWSRKDPFAPVLEPLVEGLKRRGFCFATVLEHPDYRSLARR